LIIWIFVISLVIFYVNYSKVSNFKLNENKIIHVPPWDNPINTLSRELWLSKNYLKIYLKLNPEKKINLQAWEYRLFKWEDLESIIKTINYWSIVKEEKLTILEWWNIFDIDEYLTNKNLINPWEFVSESKNIDKYKKEYSFLENALTLEWYLYPDTYFMNQNNFSIENFNKKMLDNFRKKIYDNLLSTIPKKLINDIIILASIVEKEEKNKFEKPIVAWILKKRYRENWFIGADITACYAYELTSNECKMQLSKYIAEKNEYNTRTMVWLPKTPICNPSFDSINAVINSKETPYYYYLHDKNWKVYYSRTNEEHVKNKKYLK